MMGDVYAVMRLVGETSVLTQEGLLEEVISALNFETGKSQ